MKNSRFSARLLIFILGSIPLRVRQAIGRIGGFVFALLPLRERKIATQQLRSFLGVSHPSKIVRSMYMHFGQVLMECFNLKALLENGVEYAKPDISVELLAQNDRPVIALTSHTGNWELMASFVRKRGVPLISIGRPARGSLTNDMLAEVRRIHDIEIIWRDDRSGTKELVRALKQNRWIGTLIDQDTQVTSTPIDFFGKPAQTPLSIILLGQRYNAQFISAFAIRNNAGCYEVILQKIPDSTDPKIILAEFNRRLEHLIRLYPDQWVWFHKRWRTQSDGTRLTTEEYLQMLQAENG